MGKEQIKTMISDGIKNHDTKSCDQCLCKGTRLCDLIIQERIEELKMEVSHN